jgi:hypothetical protein
MTATAATIHVFTYKDGLLARLAHDLRLSLRRFEIERDGDELRARFWPDSLVVDGVVERGGAVDSTALSDGDRRKIAGNIRDSVLLLDRFPEASFRGRLVDGGAAVEGELTLAGRAAPLRIAVQTTGGRLRAEVPLVPSRWGIAPYRALAGAIKLQDRVLVTIDLPVDPAGAAATPDQCRWIAS